MQSGSHCVPALRYMSYQSVLPRLRARKNMNPEQTRVLSLQPFRGLNPCQPVFFGTLDRRLHRGYLLLCLHARVANCQDMDKIRDIIAAGLHAEGLPRARPHIRKALKRLKKWNTKDVNYMIPRL
jgi:hypothetical protein